MNIYDIIVVGGGPAGMSAALYGLRSGKTVLLIEKENFGGQIANSPRVENFPSIKEISGLDFSNNLFDQISDLGVEFELESVEKIEKLDGIFHVFTNYGKHFAKAVILATGVKHRHIGVAREDELAGKGVSYCAVCDGAFYKGEDVVLIGDGNTAVQYALLLSNYCSKVHVCTLFDKFFADKIIVERMYQRANINITHNLSLKEFIGDDALTGLVFENTITKENVHIPCKAVFIAIGQIPNNEMYGNLVDLEKGYIIVDENKKTRTDGLYAVGDCIKKSVRQLTTATSDGSIAAINACAYIDSL